MLLHVDTGHFESYRYLQADMLTKESERDGGLRLCQGQHRSAG
jgi:hypothetical protein